MKFRSCLIQCEFCQWLQRIKIWHVPMLLFLFHPYCKTTPLHHLTEIFLQVCQTLSNLCQTSQQCLVTVSQSTALIFLFHKQALHTVITLIHTRHVQYQFKNMFRTYYSHLTRTKFRNLYITNLDNYDRFRKCAKVILSALENFILLTIWKTWLRTLYCSPTCPSQGVLASSV